MDRRAPASDQGVPMVHSRQTLSQETEVAHGPGGDACDGCSRRGWAGTNSGRAGVGYWAAARGLAARSDSSEPTFGSSKNDAEARDRGLGDRDPTRAHGDKPLERRFSGESSWRPEPEDRAQPTHIRPALYRRSSDERQDFVPISLFLEVERVPTAAVPGQWDRMSTILLRRLSPRGPS